MMHNVKFIKPWLSLVVTILAFGETTFAQPDKPGNIEPIPNYGEMNITVSWADVDDADKYHIYRAVVDHEPDYQTSI